MQPGALAFANIEEVKAALTESPKAIDYRGLSNEVVRVCGDLEYFVTNVVGDSSWYLRRKRPPSSQPLRAPYTDADLHALERRFSKPLDKSAIQQARRFKGFGEKLMKLMSA